MFITIHSPYDEAESKRTLRILNRVWERVLQALGVLLVWLSVPFLLLDDGRPVGVGLLVLGLVAIVGAGPFVTASALRAQPLALRQPIDVTITDDVLTIAYPSIEMRYRWSAFRRIIETPERWYLIFGGAFALSIGKEGMTREQEKTFSAFLDGVELAAR